MTTWFCPKTFGVSPPSFVLLISLSRSSLSQCIILRIYLLCFCLCPPRLLRLILLPPLSVLVFRVSPFIWELPKEVPDLGIIVKVLLFLSTSFSRL